MSSDDHLQALGLSDDEVGRLDRVLATVYLALDDGTVDWEDDRDVEEKALDAFIALVLSRRMPNGENIGEPDLQLVLRLIEQTHPTVHGFLQTARSTSAPWPVRERALIDLEQFQRGRQYAPPIDGSPTGMEYLDEIFEASSSGRREDVRRQSELSASYGIDQTPVGRRGRRKNTVGAVRVETQEGDDWRELGNDDAAIRLFLERRATEIGTTLVELRRPTPRGRLAPEERRRRNDLALLVTEARRRGAMQEALGRVLGRSKQRIADLERSPSASTA